MNNINSFARFGFTKQSEIQTALHSSSQLNAPASATANGSKQQLTDAELVVAYQRGDISAFEILLKRHKKYIGQAMHKAGVGLSETDEMEQRVYILAWKGLKGLREASRFRSWLSMIVQNAWKDELRKKIPDRKAISFSLDEPIGDSDDQGSDRHHLLADNNRQPASEFDYKEFERLLAEAIKRIPKPFRKTLRYRISGYAYEQIARITKTTEGTVKSRIVRGRDSLLAILFSDPDRYEPVIEKLKEFGFNRLDDEEAIAVKAKAVKLHQSTPKSTDTAATAGRRTSNTFACKQQCQSNATREAPSRGRGTKDEFGLNEQQREVLQLRFTAEGAKRSHREIARLLGFSIATVNMYLFLARKELRTRGLTETEYRQKLGLPLKAAPVPANKTRRASAKTTRRTRDEFGLSNRQREILQSRLTAEGKKRSYKDIAQMFSISVRTVELYLGKARKELTARGLTEAQYRQKLGLPVTAASLLPTTARGTRDECGLSARQTQVLQSRFTEDGGKRTHKEIAEYLGISLHTVHASIGHARSELRKLGLTETAYLARNSS